MRTNQRPSVLYQQRTPVLSIDMSAASCLLFEDEFLCCICLDVFTDPVSAPCGHNYCKSCITQHWDINRCRCPLCNKVFHTRPQLRVNTFISHMVSQFKLRTQQKSTSSSSSEQQVAKPGEVPCDVCTGNKLKALKSCLVCLSSYCDTHLQIHLKMPGLKRHQLMDPEETLFCGTDCVRQRFCDSYRYFCFPVFCAL